MQTKLEWSAYNTPNPIEALKIFRKLYKPKNIPMIENIIRISTNASDVCILENSPYIMLLDPSLIKKVFKHLTMPNTICEMLIAMNVSQMFDEYTCFLLDNLLPMIHTGKFVPDADPIDQLTFIISALTYVDLLDADIIYEPIYEHFNNYKSQEMTDYLSLCSYNTVMYQHINHNYILSKYINSRCFMNLLVYKLILHNEREQLTYVLAKLFIYLSDTYPNRQVDLYLTAYLSNMSNKELKMIAAYISESDVINNAIGLMCICSMRPFMLALAQYYGVCGELVAQHLFVEYPEIKPTNIIGQPEFINRYIDYVDVNMFVVNMSKFINNIRVADDEVLANLMHSDMASIQNTYSENVVVNLLCNLDKQSVIDMHFNNILSGKMEMQYMPICLKHGTFDKYTLIKYALFRDYEWKEIVVDNNFEDLAYIIECSYKNRYNIAYLSPNADKEKLIKDFVNLFISPIKKLLCTTSQ